MIKLKELLKGKKTLLKESTYVKGKMNVLLKHAERYWNQFYHIEKKGFIDNVTKSSSVKQGVDDGNISAYDVTKFEGKINQAFDVMKKDVEKAHKKWEKNIEKATKPFDKEYTGV